MIATCQFCKEMVRGPENRSLDIDARHAWEYRQLSMLVSAHMMDNHNDECGREIIMTSAMASAAIAMRFVTSADPAVDQWRVRSGEALMETFQPAPTTPLVSLSD